MKGSESAFGQPNKALNSLSRNLFSSFIKSAAYPSTSADPQAEVHMTSRALN
jgi:hypothetical protein